MSRAYSCVRHILCAVPTVMSVILLWGAYCCMGHTILSSKLVYKILRNNSVKSSSLLQFLLRKLCPPNAMCMGYSLIQHNHTNTMKIFMLVSKNATGMQCLLYISQMQNQHKPNPYFKSVVTLPGDKLWLSPCLSHCSIKLLTIKPVSP